MNSLIIGEESGEVITVRNVKDAKSEEYAKIERSPEL